MTSSRTTTIHQTRSRPLARRDAVGHRTRPQPGSTIHAKHGSVAVRVTLLGPPGSGKGTQGASLAHALGSPHVVRSDLLHGAAEADGGDDAQHALTGGIWSTTPQSSTS